MNTLRYLQRGSAVMTPDEVARSPILPQVTVQKVPLTGRSMPKEQRTQSHPKTYTGSVQRMLKDLSVSDTVCVACWRVVV